MRTIYGPWMKEIITKTEGITSMEMAEIASRFGAGGVHPTDFVCRLRLSRRYTVETLGYAMDIRDDPNAHYNAKLYRVSRKTEATATEMQDTKALANSEDP